MRARPGAQSRDWRAHLGLTHTFRPNLAVTIRAGALVRTRQVVALLAGAAVVQGLSTLVHVCRRHRSAPACKPMYHPT